MKKLLIVFLFCPGSVWCQDVFLDTLVRRAEISRKKVAEYSAKHQIPIRQVFPNGKVIELQDVDRFGQPVYYTTFNSEAAFTTSTVSLYAGSKLGIGIAGNGMTAGVWDAGTILGNHVELTGKTNQKDNPLALSTHSTHVTGTITARGINPLAKGMAYKSNVINFDWTSVEPEMQAEASQGLLISNHSWGLSTGWDYNSSNNSWVWFGNSSVSTAEDYRFGIYTGTSATWDRIAYENPNFLIVKSAGNDRGDFGNGVGAPADGPFDSIEPLAVGKNILTVGAVNPLSAAYSGPQDVVMSSFSSWGPTDDGRIKPDLVGAGVNILSSSSTSTTAYIQLSGTSMATPNVTGSLILLQELYSKLHGSPMKSSTLKGLAIHTVNETGSQDGPDFQYGWGLLNMERAARLLLIQNGSEFQVEEGRLNSGNTYQKTISVLQGQKVTATICWTDPEGPAESRSILDPPDLRLVNDLDMRITKGVNIFYPWVIAANTFVVSKEDNFRDNVEKIEFIAPENGTYTLTIGHKNSLQTGGQDFSLILSTKNVDAQLSTLYFVGTSTNWNDPANWAGIPGGTPVNRIPTASDIVIFDTSAQSQSVQLPSDAVCFSLTFVDSKVLSVNLNHHNISVFGSLFSENPNLLLQNGTLKFRNSVQSQFIDCLDNFQGVGFEMSGTGSYILQSGLSVDSLRILSGSFKAIGKTIQIPVIEFKSGDVKQVDISSSSLNGLHVLSNKGTNLTLTSTNAKLKFSGSRGFLDVSSGFREINFASDSGYIIKSVQAQKLSVTGDFVVKSDIQVDTLTIDKAQSVSIAGTKTLTINDQFYFNPLIAGTTKIGALPATGLGIMAGIKSKKICLPVVTIDNVNATGPYKFVVAPGSVVTNSPGWIVSLCSDVLFADFTSGFTCTGGIAEFSDASDGNPTSWTWDFGNGVTATGPVAHHIFDVQGTYQVKLTVGKNAETHTSIKEVKIVKGDVNQPQVVVKDGILWSTAFAPFYQWYHNDLIIPNAISYTLDNFSDPGSYVIDIYSTKCRMRSGPYIVTALPDGAWSQPMAASSVYPNPTTGNLTVSGDGKDIHSVHLYGIQGNRIMTAEYPDGTGSVTLDLFSLSEGMYLLKVITQAGPSVVKVLKK